MTTDTLYKILVDGESCHGGDMAWSLPNGKPGEWMRCEGKLSICESGIHLTNKIESWLKLGCRIYEAEAEGVADRMDDKCVCRAARLIAEVERPAWWLDVERFVSDEIKTCPWFKNNSELTVKHKRYAAWDAARYAAWDAARAAARAAAWDTAWDAARAAVLQCLMTTVCADLPIAVPHRQNAADFWSIWRAGFGCVGKVGDEYYVYERP